MLKKYSKILLSLSALIVSFGTVSFAATTTTQPSLPVNRMKYCPTIIKPVYQTMEGTLVKVNTGFALKTDKNLIMLRGNTKGMEKVIGKRVLVRGFYEKRYDTCKRTYLDIVSPYFVVLDYKILDVKILPIDPVKPVKPVEPVKPIYPITPGDPVKPVK